MLSRDCDGCSQYKACSRRYRNAKKGEKVYCPDGTAHLIDDGTNDSIDLYEHYHEMMH
ncbi:MAG: hypothetical protein GX638_11045 [Crenarchaeota archaeon]|nr:hypothetical protein [Thermoproteota archaeon]